MPGSGIPENRVFSLDAVRLSVDPAEHPWRLSEASLIEAHWAREQVERPFLYNGSILLQRSLQLSAGVMTGVSHRAPYASLLHWLQARPQADVWHLFGSAVMLSSDGAMLLIRMARNTANAGKVYAPAGSLDENDIKGGEVDLEGSIRREALEETGCDLSAARAENRLLCWRQGGLVAVFRRYLIDETAAVLAERIRDHIATGAEDEIEDVVVVRTPGDAGPTVTPYMRALVEFHFSGANADSGWQAGENG